MQQHLLLQVCGGAQATEQCRRADWRELFVEQVSRFGGLLGDGRIDHRRIELLAAKVHGVGHGSGEFHRHVRALLLPLHQAWQQPAHHAGGRLELQGLAAAADLLHCLTDQAKHLLGAQ